MEQKTFADRFNGIYDRMDAEQQHCVRLATVAVFNDALLDYLAERSPIATSAEVLESGDFSLAPLHMQQVLSDFIETGQDDMHLFSEIVRQLKQRPGIGVMTDLFDAYLEKVDPAVQPATDREEVDAFMEQFRKAFPDHERFEQAFRTRRDIRRRSAAARRGPEGAR